MINGLSRDRRLRPRLVTVARGGSAQGCSWGQHDPRASDEAHRPDGSQEPDGAEARAVPKIAGGLRGPRHVSELPGRHGPRGPLPALLPSARRERSFLRFVLILRLPGGASLEGARARREGGRGDANGWGGFILCGGNGSRLPAEAAKSKLLFGTVACASPRLRRTLSRRGTEIGKGTGDGWIMRSTS